MELDPRLFWDSDPSKIDYERHVRHIIERVVTRGTLEEWRTIVRYYGKERIKEEAVQIRDLDPKSLAFLSVVLDTPTEEFKATQNLEHSQRHPASKTHHPAMTFSKNLFWDSDVTKLDYGRNAKAIIARVVEWGTLEDWYTILHHYGIARLILESVQIRTLEPKAHSFLATVLDIPLENFRCYKEKQSYQELYHF